MRRRHCFLILIILLNIMAMVYYYRSCSFWDYCSSRKGVFLLSEDQEKHQIMQAAVGEAEGRINVLFAFKEVPSTIIMDTGLTEPFPVRLRSQWRMVYDPTGSRRMEDVLESIGLEAAVDRFLLRSEDFEPASLASEDERRDAVLNTAAHEVCHMFFHNIMDTRPYSDALDEIAAISCESDDSINRRVEQFERLMQERPPMEWDTFLRQRHPIKRQAELVEAMNKASEETDEALEFTVDLGSELGRQIDLFYHQSAVFVRFWQQRCPAQGVLHNFAIAASNDKSFSDWLLTNNFECSPRNIQEFEDAISESFR